MEKKGNFVLKRIPEILDCWSERWSQFGAKREVLGIGSDFCHRCVMNAAVAIASRQDVTPFTSEQQAKWLLKFANLYLWSQLSKLYCQLHPSDDPSQIKKHNRIPLVIREARLMAWVSDCWDQNKLWILCSSAARKKWPLYDLPSENDSGTDAYFLCSEVRCAPCFITFHPLQPRRGESWPRSLSHHIAS